MVPRRQLTYLHITVAKLAGAVIDFVSGMCCWRGRSRLAMGKIIFTPAGETFCLNAMPTALVNPRAPSACRKAPLKPYPVRARTQPKRAPATRTRPRVAKAHCSQFEAYASNHRVTRTRVLKNNGCGKSELCKITATYQTKTRSTSWRYPRKHANVAGNVTLIKNSVNQLQCNI